MVVFRVISFCLAGIGTATSIPIWYMMISIHFLHPNFRTLIFLLTFGAQFAMVSSYMKAICIQFDCKSQVVVKLVGSFGRCCGILFYMSNLALCIERGIAVLTVSKYEKCVSPAITILITLSTVFVSVVIGVFLNIFVEHYSTFPILIFVISYSALSFLVAISVRIYRKTSRKVAQVTTLQKRYQDKENGRTASVYTFISFNELLSSLAITGAYAWMVAAKAKNPEANLDFLNSFPDLIDSYRILFINVTILLNCLLWSRNQTKISVENHMEDGDKYFMHLQTLWETTHNSLHRNVAQ